jgi:carboxyl-terminal processing protease
MTFRKFLLIPIIGLIVLASATLPDYLNDANPERESLILKLVIDGLGELHYEPQKIDDKFSARVYELYMDKLDNGKRFLTQADIKKLESYQTKLDDEARAGSFEFLDLSISLFENRKSQIQEYYQEILAEPFDFTVDEELEMDAKKLDYPKNEKALKELWRKSLKYQTMTRLANLLDDEKVADNGKDLAPATYEELEKEAREKVLKVHDDWFARMVKIDREDRFSLYLNSVAGAYDPHTNYFPPQDKENFDISMSGRLEGIGARLQEDGKYVKVVSIVAGSPCWKQGELEVGDKIAAVSQGKGEAIDATDMPIDDVVSMIRGEKGSEVRLTVKKRDNTLKIIPIIRDIVEMEESYAKSAILESNGQKIGFIHLPKFYTDFQRNGGRRCATDIKDELTKLMKENVDGVILDLRNNGGGSLSDVVEMGGLFVDEGPMVQVKQSNGKVRVLSDDDKGVHYNGVLIIMVNTFSASASEILAAALQDYGRAIIVGSSATFGKGTVQQFIDLDRMVRSSEVEKLGSLGSVKLTTQKFYRINGGTTQLQGVKPDITIPDDYTYLEVGEKEEFFALPWDEIPAAKYEQFQMKKLNKLKKSSAERVASDATLSAIDDNAKRFKQRRDETVYSLNLAKYRSEAKQVVAENKKLEALETDIEGLTIVAPKADQASIDADESKAGRIKEWHKALQKDAQLKETLAIMKDML